VNGEGLVAPVLALYSDNRLVGERALDPGSFLTYSVSLPLSRAGRYTAVLHSRGAPLLRLPVYFNGSMEGQTTESRIALQVYNARFFRALPTSKLYLILFFLASITVTFLSRQTRRRSAGEEV
jgi:hypothetical protein